MKLRLHQDTVRVRLTQEEVATLAAGKLVRSETRFFSGTLKVDVQAFEGAERIQAVFTDAVISIGVPLHSVVAWAASDAEGLYASIDTTKIAIEKDYACLHKQGAENEGTYPNPAATDPGLPQ
jgi:hypothetical protein